MTPNLRSITARQIVSALHKDGWTWARSRGSHRCYEKGSKTVIIPYHHPGATLTPGTLADVLSGTGWTDDDLRRLKLLK